MTIGNTGAGEFMDGVIDDVRIWNKALSRSAGSSSFRTLRSSQSRDDVNEALAISPLGILTLFGHFAGRHFRFGQRVQQRPRHLVRRIDFDRFSKIGFDL